VELYGAAAVVIVMYIFRKLADVSGSDERAVVAGVLAMTASIGGAVLFQALAS
jgi:hypothetical protein